MTKISKNVLLADSLINQLTDVEEARLVVIEQGNAAVSATLLAISASNASPRWAGIFNSESYYGYADEVGYNGDVWIWVSAESGSGSVPTTGSVNWNLRSTAVGAIDGFVALRDSAIEAAASASYAADVAFASASYAATAADVAFASASLVSTVLTEVEATASLAEAAAIIAHASASLITIAVSASMIATISASNAAILANVFANAANQSASLASDAATNAFISASLSYDAAMNANISASLAYDAATTLYVTSSLAYDAAQVSYASASLASSATTDAITATLIASTSASLAGNAANIALTSASFAGRAATSASVATAAVLTGLITLANQKSGSFGITINGQGGVPTTGSHGFTIVTYSGSISNWYVIADRSGSAVIDLRRNGVSIIGSGSNKPTLTSNQRANAPASSSWTSRTVSINDEIEFVLESATTLTRINLIVEVTKL